MSGIDAVSGDSPGRILRSAREALGLSRREIAEALNLLESTVIAIEEDDTARQPELVFLRGYVRNYAKLLRLDPEPLVGALVIERAPKTPVAPVRPEPSNRWLWPVAGALFAILVLIGVVFYLLQASTRNDGGEDLALVQGAEIPTVEEMGPQGEINAERAAGAAGWPSPGTSGVESALSGSEPMSDLATEPDTLAADDEQQLVEVDGEPEPDMAGPLSAGDVALNREVPPPDTALTEAAPTGAITADASTLALPPGPVKPRRLNQGGQDRIELTFATDCWVRIKDQTGKMLFSDMGRAGGTMALVGRGPFDVLLGNATGATLAWNGEAVPLQPHMRNNVASIKLGMAPDA